MEIVFNFYQWAYQYKYFSCLALVGAIAVLKLLQIIGYFIYTLVRPGKNLLARYGNGYAVVTGASDGIGKVYAQHFADMGFNLVLISRSIEKLQLVKNEILAKHSDLDICIISFDFSKGTAADYKPLQNQLDCLDVCILVNNVGIIKFHKFHEISDFEIENMVKVNEYSCIYMSKMVIPNMLKRNKRSGIYIMSSGLRTSISAYVSLYAITTTAVSSLAKSLWLEYSGKIDICCFEIGPVSSSTNKDKSIRHITAEQCVSSCLNKVGFDSISFGHWKHRILRTLTQYLTRKARIKRGERVYNLRKNE